MSTEFLQVGQTVLICNEVELSLENFKLLEPTYPDLPAGYSTRVYRPGELHVLSGNGRVTIQEPTNWKDGDRYIKRKTDFKRLSEKISLEEDVVKKELEKRRPYRDVRKEHYPQIEELVVALWEHIVENKSQEEAGIQKLQALRNLVKERFPKSKAKTK